MSIFLLDPTISLFAFFFFSKQYLKGLFFSGKQKEF